MRGVLAILCGAMAVMGGSLFGEEVVERRAMVIMGIDCRTSNAVEAGPVDIPKLWGRFYSEDVMGQIPNKVSTDVIALYCDYESDFRGEFDVVIGCEVGVVEGLPEGMVVKNIPASSYTVFRAKGEFPASLIETWGTIWKREDLDRTYTGDFEVYGKSFSEGNGVEIFIAVPEGKK